MALKIEIVTIGNELLDGLVVNTNAAYLCEELSKLGLSVRAYQAIPDERASLRQRLERALRENSLVICTGGLGPTCDDNTKHVVAEIFNSGFRFDDGIAASLRERYGDDLASLQHQATVPAKATVLPNEVGTAPALLFEATTVTLILLPGVPFEMRSIWELSVKPYLMSRLSDVVRKITHNILLTSVREDEIDPLLRRIEKDYPELDVGIYTKPGMNTVVLSGHEDTPDIHKILQSASALIFEQFSDRAISANTGKIEEAVQQLFISRGLTLSTAESCTGGAIAAKLTSQPGSSQYYQGSIIAYSNYLKMRLLAVQQDTLEEEGAVSEETAIEMARGALVATGTEYSLAITGIAGPDGGTEQKPVGTVWIAVANRSGFVLTWKLSLKGIRSKIIDATVNAALCRLWQAVNYF
ncbi:MAG: nicotinamide-nucleotide amidohydrolase family protein [Chlamydiales bacterium]|nr:nicotinamide-nucleotide amidohydrolase family protein [Chlamydiales bacterium]